MNGELSEYQQKQERLDMLIRDAETASKEQDYERAAQLTEEAGRLRSELDKLEEQSGLSQLREHIPEAEIDFEIGRRNFVRAAMLAEQHQYPLEKVRYLQELALKQYACEYRNAQGLQKLIREYGFSKSDVVRVMDEGLSEWKGYTGLQYDISTMSHITLQQFIDNFVRSEI